MQLRALWSNSLVDVTSSAAQFINDVLVYNDTYFQYVLIFLGVTRVCGAFSNQIQVLSSDMKKCKCVHCGHDATKVVLL